jgi:hypothetical protein
VCTILQNQPVLDRVTAEDLEAERLIKLPRSL